MNNLPVGAHSARPFPIQSNRGSIPWWYAEILWVRYTRVMEADGVIVAGSDMLTIETTLGGFAPLWMLDIAAGGIGIGDAWSAVRKGHGLFKRALVLDGFSLTRIGGPETQEEDPIDELNRLSRGDTRPFPTLGDRDTAGNGIAPGTIPRWLAELLYDQWERVMLAGVPSAIPTLARLEAEGGFPPMFLLDVPAGGDGRGAAWQTVQRMGASKLAERSGFDSPEHIKVVRTLPRRLPDIK